MKVLFALRLLTPLLGWGQANSDAVLMIDLEKIAWYALDPADSAKWKTSPNPTPLPSTFVFTPMTHLLFADVVAINGNPAKGTFAAWGICHIVFAASDVRTRAADCRHHQKPNLKHAG